MTKKITSNERVLPGVIFATGKNVYYIILFEKGM